LGGGGHAVEITASGEFDFNANTFTDFGTNESNLAAILNSSGGEVILNIIGGGNTPTYKNIAPSTTVVNNKKYITLTGLQSNTEVRAYLDSGGNNGVEIDGIENSGTTFTFAVDPNTTINIMINHLSYLPADIWQLEVGTTDLTLPIKQFVDRQYYNPPGPDPLAGQGLMIHDFITGTTQTTSSSTYVTALELNSTVPEGYYIIQWGGTISRTISGGVFGQTRVSVNTNVVAESEEQFANENYQFPFSGFYYVYLNGAVNVLIEFEGNGQQIDLLLPSIYILGGTP
jgi:hypothetical protein